MDSVYRHIVNQLKKVLKSSFPEIEFQEIDFNLIAPPRPEMGDYVFPCFNLAKILKKSPPEVARELSPGIKADKIIEEAEAVGPYLNFFVDKKIIAREVLAKINKNYGRSNLGKGKTAVVDFSQPNVGKPMHVGHIRSTILGDSLVKIYQFSGWKTVGVNYLGDVGLHLGKIIVAYELWLDKKALKQDPIKELLRLYVKFCEQEKLAGGRDDYDEMDSQGDSLTSHKDDYSQNEWTDKAKDKLKLLEEGDEKTCRIWQEIIKYSEEGFNRIYDLLNIKFTETVGQSHFSDAGKKIVFGALKKGLAKTDPPTGAIYAELDDLPLKYVLRSNQTASYITQDLGAAAERDKKYKFSKMVYVVDKRQNLHFQQLFAILKKFGYKFYQKCHHLAFGTVSFGKEIMATRQGKVLLLEEVLKKTVEKAAEEIKKRKTKGDARKVGVGAIKYIILRSEPIKDVEFSWETALNFEGETGPYLQYSYARASSIIRKSSQKPRLRIPAQIENKEMELIKKMAEFPEIVKSAADRLNPAIVAHYVYQLAQVFNEFYHSCPVINSPLESFRLKIVDGFRLTLKNALYLLGIEVMYEM